ncbi:hypothetical protein [Rubripirellula tenax]|uniref:hypothetical protein n=1 Tax=Rubripirellula tenax TaxID=2528015 RepID=UPI0011B5C05E|nr:hypothetical protein [Rubripirellula tenax]
MPPEGWTGPVFELSQDYPTSLPSPEEYPWNDIDFKTEPGDYLDAVLGYVVAGNTAVDWRIQDNAVRKWYHAPWMHWGPRGREFIHGLTQERTSRPHELAPTQDSRFQNWAVGFYNALGGYTIGQVWNDPDNPDATNALFPVGTVTAKLLFTAATVDEVPFLENAFEWEANVKKNLSTSEREPRMMKLLQIDVAIRDSRADDTTGWVFGTFVYSNDHSGNNGFEKMRPVGLQWGNDPTATPASVAGTPLVETWLNPNVTLQHYGYAGRMNGPVDNPISSCLSCHATAQIPTSSPMTFPSSASETERLRWFRNVPAGEPFDTGAISTDYSLQIAFGILNQKQSKNADFAALANALEQAQVANNIAASSKRVLELEKNREQFDEPMIIDGQKYFPVSRGD